MYVLARLRRAAVWTCRHRGGLCDGDMDGCRRGGLLRTDVSQRHGLAEQHRCIRTQLGQLRTSVAHCQCRRSGELTEVGAVQDSFTGDGSFLRVSN